jgi:hypothetical protein
VDNTTCTKSRKEYYNHALGGNLFFCIEAALLLLSLGSIESLRFDKLLPESLPLDELAERSVASSAFSIDFETEIR